MYFFHSSVLKHASVVCLMANELGTVCKQPSIVRGELTRCSDKDGGYDDDGQWQKEKLRFRNKPVHSLTHCRSHLLPFLWQCIGPPAEKLTGDRYVTTKCRLGHKGIKRE